MIAGTLRSPRHPARAQPGESAPVPTWKQILLILLPGPPGAGGYWFYDAKLRPAEAVGAEAEKPRVTVEIATAEELRLAELVEAVGTTRALRSVEIVPLAAGRVTEIHFRAGQQVEKGDVLVRLDDDIERADLTEAKALLVEARQAVERVQKLRKSNAVALAELERATAQFAAATATMERAERRLADREIRAPLAGVVGLSDVDFGAHVAVGTTITTLDDLSSVEIEFSLPEGLFAAIRIGQQIAASSVAYPKQSFAGEVIAIGTRIDPVSRAFRVRAVVANPDRALPAGMFMFLTLAIEESSAVMVPEEAVIADAARSHVFVIEGDRAESRAVLTGQRRQGAVAILDGVQAGETVAIRGLERLQDGAAIRVLDAPATAAAEPQQGGAGGCRVVPFDGR